MKGSKNQDELNVSQICLAWLEYGDSFIDQV